MPREHQFLLKDMSAACEKIQRYTKELTAEAFLTKEETFDAVMRNLSIIGEAASRVPQEVRDQISVIPWRKIIAFRNIAIHEYFGIDTEIVWDIIRNEVPALHDKLRPLITE